MTSSVGREPIIVALVHIDDATTDQRAKIVAAARSAAVWARARRATWTDVPLPVPAPPAPIAVPPAPIEPAIAETPEIPAVIEPPDAIEPPRERGPIISEELRERVSGWMPRVIAGAALVVLGSVGVSYGPAAWQTIAARMRTATAPPRPKPAPPPKATGTVDIASTPSGARIKLDGAARGVTPLTIDDVQPGRHEVVLESSVGTVQRAITVTAGATATVNESIFAGFLVVYSPFDLSIAEGARAYQLDDRSQLMLAPGHHELRFANRALGYEETRAVDLAPGQKLTISITPPPSTLTVTSTDAADVWVDGKRLGSTPFSSTAIALGTHNIVVRRSNGDERRSTITVTMKPFVLAVDFSKP